MKLDNRTNLTNKTQKHARCTVICTNRSEMAGDGSGNGGVVRKRRKEVYNSSFQRYFETMEKMHLQYNL
jgi:hypothetical protein